MKIELQYFLAHQTNNMSQTIPGLLFVGSWEVLENAIKRSLQGKGFAFVRKGARFYDHNELYIGNHKDEEGTTLAKARFLRRNITTPNSLTGAELDLLSAPLDSNEELLGYLEKSISEKSTPEKLTSLSPITVFVCIDLRGELVEKYQRARLVYLQRGGRE